MLSESLGNCDDDVSDNNKERFTEQHNNSAQHTALFEPKSLTQLLETWENWNNRNELV